MNVDKLIKPENHVEILQVLVISKQDAAIQNAITALNSLHNINIIEFESYGKNYGLSNELLSEISALQTKLEKAKYNRF